VGLKQASTEHDVNRSRRSTILVHLLLLSYSAATAQQVLRFIARLSEPPLKFGFNALVTAGILPRESNDITGEGSVMEQPGTG
jgi:hypothetical protein